MASVDNRSRYIVSVKNNETLTKEFGFRRFKEAEGYLAALRANGYSSAKIARADDCFLVRFRELRLRKFSRHVESREKARELIELVEAQSNDETPLDYLVGAVSFAKLADRYIEEICKIHKGGTVETYTLSSMLRDAGYVSKFEARIRTVREKKKQASEEAKRLAAARPKNKNMARVKKKADATETKKKEKKEPRKRGHVNWMIRPIREVTNKHIQRFVSANTGELISDETDTLNEKATVVSLATVDRELDLISQVIRWAIDKEGLAIKNPMQGVTRPKYNNERDVRLLDGEEEQLLDAAREEDRIQSRNRAIQKLLEPVRAKAAALDGSESTRKRYIAAERRTIETNLTTFEIVPLYETLIVFLLATAARRGEALALLWANTNLLERTAFFPETKNGTARTAPLRAHLIDLLSKLSSTRDAAEPRVFPVSGDSWDGAWDRIRARAGLDEDFRRHDLRHEAISQIAEAGYASGMPFDLVTLAAITGHRDVRSLQRYLNPHKGKLATHMDRVFEAARKGEQIHKGRIRLTREQERQLMQPEIATSKHRPPIEEAPTAPSTLSCLIAI
ncbi:site-specific integrase [Povalibacter sp.]|uniref:tyrosine-type recombinase/integrase n=1 Tax=Povalibacter sp. TaxID=1962978 RepID=UPI002F418743